MPLSRNTAVVLALCLCAAAICSQAADVRVAGLFSGRAVLLIDGKQRLLKQGQTSPEGVKLIAATSEEAVLLIDGQQVTARLDGRVSARKRAPEINEVQVWRDTTGMYTTVGSINGLPVSFLVDTGATAVAMNAKQARRLGIDFRVVGRQSGVTTASGVVHAWTVMLDTVKVGDLELRNVEAVVLEGVHPETALLGMSYLGRLEIDNDGRLMTLRKKY
ncbi:MAG: TIGR02281 family clan AA aspartic protease [Gammaproteobacteria bacterium]|nr:TIGR02281 family clan AA aspartic protease [Gammaproteobacteria bacterium]